MNNRKALLIALLWGISVAVVSFKYWPRSETAVLENTSPDPDGIAAGDRLRLQRTEDWRPSRYVMVANPKGRHPLFSRNLEFGDPCEIKEGNELRVLNVTEKEILIEYVDGDDSFMECPDGTIFIQSREWYLEARKKTLEVQREKDRIRELLNGSKRKH